MVAVPAVAVVAVVVVVAAVVPLAVVLVVVNAAAATTAAAAMGIVAAVGTPEEDGLAQMERLEGRDDVAEISPTMWGDQNDPLIWSRPLSIVIAEKNFMIDEI